VTRGGAFTVRSLRQDRRAEPDGEQRGDRPRDVRIAAHALTPVVALDRLHRPLERRNEAVEPAQRTLKKRRGKGAKMASMSRRVPQESAAKEEA
jgi:hypothetical protein